MPSKPSKKKTTAKKSTKTHAPGSRAWWLAKARAARDAGELERAAACELRAAEVTP